MKYYFLNVKLKLLRIISLFKKGNKISLISFNINI